MTDPQWTEPQRELMAILYGDQGLWDPPCQHPGPVWVTDPDGTGRCTMCPARWTMADEDERAARIAAGPPEGESDNDRRWREFREAVHASRPMILPLPPPEATGVQISVMSGQEAGLQRLLREAQTAGEVSTEYAQLDGNGVFLVWDSSPDAESGFPLAERIRLARSYGGLIFRRRVIVAEDWEQVAEP